MYFGLFKLDAANVFLGNPIRFGFPVVIVIDGKGKVLHIQDSALLEAGQGYDQKKGSGIHEGLDSICSYSEKIIPWCFRFSVAPAGSLPF